MHLLIYVENEAVQPCFKNRINSNVTESLLNDVNNLFDKEDPLASKESTIISPEESKSVVTDDMHLLNYVENEAVQPCFKNRINSNVTESLLNDVDNLFDKEDPLASKENTIISPEESKSVVADDMHLLNNVENEDIQPIFRNWINFNNRYDLALSETDQHKYPIEDCSFDNLLQNDLYNAENETEINFLSECYDKTPNKYQNLLPKLNENFNSNNSNTFSDSYSEDSGSDYMPPIRSPTSDNCNSSEVFSEKSDLSIDQFIHEDEYNICEPSTSFTDPNEKQNFQKPVNNLSKKNKKGYNFTGSVEVSKKKPINNKRCRDKIDNCIFCEKNVTNFTRHIIRNHSTEMEVARYLSLKKGSKDRKKISDELRKRGNFLCNIGGEQKIKPVRRPNAFSETPDATQYLPCKYCYGLYKRLYLFRHIKHCKSKISEPKQDRNNRAQADAHNILLAFTEHNTQLINEVFPRMAVDAISTVAKTDHLIKAFGSRYLKCHKEKHLINVVSQKMRTLARLVIQMKVEVPGIKSLQDCLVPKYFDHIVKCTKIVAGYDTSTDTFGSPSVILKMGSSLKQCCDIAEFNLLKNCDNLVLDEQQRNIQQSIINMRSIIDKQWSYDVSTNASKEMYQKKWNKPAYLPLTSDIMLFRNHLINIQNQCVKALKIDFNNLKAYKELQESILAQLILLNRRRSGEVQRIFLETYISAPSEVSQEEVESSLSEMERHLTQQFKRIVIRGKRGRGVPILFTPSLQKSIKLLLETRKVTNYIDKQNTYLFALPNSMSCLRGSDAIRKLSKDCGAKNPKNLTSTRLRKQVATVAQLLNLSESDIEQLATFMGHSKKVHKQFYRLSESTFLVAKVSKLLLMMEKGQGRSIEVKV